MGELLSLVDVCKGFSRGGQWTNVLNDVCVALQPGEITAIVGGRLVGKTTLLKIAAGIEAADRGGVLLAGQSLSELSERSRAQLLGHDILWIDRAGPGPEVEVSSFVGWPLALHGYGRRGAERTAQRAFERVGAQECIGRTWPELSNSEQLLVGLARAFAGSPRVVLIDDLLDALATGASEEASDLLRGLLEESERPCAVVTTVSDMDSAVLADRVFSLTRKGELKPFSGPTGGHADIIPIRKHAGG